MVGKKAQQKEVNLKIGRNTRLSFVNVVVVHQVFCPRDEYLDTHCLCDWCFQEVLPQYIIAANDYFRNP